MKITAVIPIRSGSQCVKDKNLRAFADTNLMELKIKNLLQVPELTSIVVNTNSELAIEIVNKSYRGGLLTVVKSITPLHNVAEVNFLDI